MAILFSQTRIGKDNKPFKIYKFETMREGIITRPFLRKSGLDELPQIWNIIKRDMNLFGPRPELPDIHQTCSRQIGDIWDSRHRVRPGILSIASICGEIRQKNRYDINVKVEQAIYDNTMIDDMSFKVRWNILRQLPNTLRKGQEI